MKIFKGFKIPTFDELKQDPEMINADFIPIMHVSGKNFKLPVSFKDLESIPEEKANELLDKVGCGLASIEAKYI